MRSVPSQHRQRSHAALLRGLATDARARFRDVAPAWDPLRPSEVAPDLGRGFLDSYALALHVLWTYQQSWAEEGFLPTARLPASAARLLELIGYAPRPASAATGLQHFRAKPGKQTTLPPGFKVGAAADGPLPAAIYETLRATAVDAALNELRPFLPPPDPNTAGQGGTPGAITDVVALLAPEVNVPPPDDNSPAGLARALDRRLGTALGGAVARRNAERARMKALQLAELAQDLAGTGASGGPACQEAFAKLCQQVCEAQALANKVPDTADPIALSESQQMLSAQLGRLVERQPDAMAGLSTALARQQGESNADWSKRLDQLMAFLDALIAGMLQEARDQVVRLRGNRALTLMDRAAASTAGGTEMGVAMVGTDSVYLMPDTTGPVPVTQTALLRPGDWLVFAEETTTVAANGATQRERTYREAVRLERVFDEIPEGQTDTMTRVVFQPPLTRLYLLANTVVIGNVAEISHGRTVDAPLPPIADDGTIALEQTPLTWLRDPAAPDGLVPQAGFSVAGQAWRRAEDLLAAAPSDPVFAVETAPDGTSRLRVGDGRNGSTVPVPAPTTLRYRVGAGPDGNRKPGAVKALLDADAAILETFNPLPVSGGSAAEPPAQSRTKAAAGIHALRHAISLSDVRSLALTYGGVQRASVIHDPVHARQNLTLIVDGDGGAALTDAERAALAGFLLARMPPGTKITVVNRTIVPVRLRMRLSLAADADPLAVIRTVRLRLGADVVDGEPPGLMQSDTIDLGRDLALSAVYRAVEAIGGLLTTTVELFHRAADTPARRDVIQVTDHEVPVWDGTVGAQEGVQILWR
ncbi:MAG: hypothetical protein U1E70_14910 [Acetobacteraceae bacterium]